MALYPRAARYLASNRTRVEKSYTHSSSPIQYRIIGSPDVYAVQYDTGHIIKSAKDFNTEEIKDIREKDLEGKFNNYRIRKYPILIM